MKIGEQPEEATMSRVQFGAVSVLSDFVYIGLCRRGEKTEWAAFRRSARDDKTPPVRLSDSV